MGVRKSTELKTVKAVSDIKCLWENVIVKPELAEEIGGIIIPEQSKEKGQKGLVCRVGPGTKELKMEVEEGDRVFHVKWAGSEVSIDGEKFLIMKQDDILGKYHGPGELDLTPLESRVLIEWEEGASEIKGTNLLRPDGSAKERYYNGIVMAVGPLVTELKVGDRVNFNQFCGPERISVNGKRYAMIWENDARCIVPLRKNILALSH